MYQGLMQQSALLAYIDVFFTVAVMALCCVPFIFLFRKVTSSGTTMVH